MVLKIVNYGDPILRKVGRSITKVTPEIRELVADMIDKMHEAHGIGLAAQQVGRDLQLAVIDIPKDIERPSRMWLEGKEVDLHDYMPLVLINPQITLTKKKETDSEGCLSFPGLTVEVSRGYRVSVTCMNLEGKTWSFDAAGLLGRAVQHEVDHLNGILFIDRLTKAERALAQGEIDALRGQSVTAG
ncbi:MAG: peptide deformylase [Blastochloris sp.]|nr:peptide deformylase [Blastochloris sp.]